MWICGFQNLLLLNNCTGFCSSFINTYSAKFAWEITQTLPVTKLSHYFYSKTFCFGGAFSGKFGLCSLTLSFIPVNIWIFFISPKLFSYASWHESLINNWRFSIVSTSTFSSTWVETRCRCGASTTAQVWRRFWPDSQILLTAFRWRTDSLFQITELLILQR